MGTQKLSFCRFLAILLVICFTVFCFTLPESGNFFLALFGG
ncbi:hypothetical protein AM305_06296 [Actinobacillus minor NM305]|uniref:Uncharacterized protein n=1 Tax=Actinobacillus minor NM305 TaxID=637911 RepID=C5S036_9PAST|nr:hypothetical protein [Actinobacillus minor]EER47774.1 hypothetical protein AM305_06296 [Actinobacillus minor NM305]MDY5107606.1 hypothetical protein [Actinobacillus minor]